MLTHETTLQALGEAGGTFGDSNGMRGLTEDNPVPTTSLLKWLKTAKNWVKSGKVAVTNQDKKLVLASFEKETLNLLTFSLPITADNLDRMLSTDPGILRCEELFDLRHALALAKIETLTDRELEIFELMGGGRLTNRAIAEKLGISTKTLDIHRANIFRKLKTKLLPELCRIYWFFQTCGEEIPLRTTRAEKQTKDPS